jgi:hypothetical protein
MSTKLTNTLFQGLMMAAVVAAALPMPDLALAQIAATDLERDTLAACYTFGSPRVATRPT